ncbi:hypothetical protein AYX14_02767 [Cryptococcus neoformans]|nr:hypothetical protein AYX15_05840 [Cryptococcus neoformans var. grubii]OWZ71785.1 hypothetical protein AYX14_02767 [Cryptococcus neoformans var. grubii]OXG30267.1 hypothetical protein C367_01944 [Cryptococcus neoformans var. grubii Ze90-1]
MSVQQLPRGSNQPSSFSKLLPVQDYIFDELLLIAPLSTITLTRRHYQKTIRTIYREVPVSNKLFCSLLCGDRTAFERGVNAFEHTRILRIKNFEGFSILTQFHIPLLFATLRNRKIFYNVERIDISWEAIKTFFFTRWCQGFPATTSDDSRLLMSHVGRKFREVVLYVDVGDPTSGECSEDIQAIADYFSPRTMTMVSGYHPRSDFLVIRQNVNAQLLPISWMGSQTSRLIIPRWPLMVKPGCSMEESDEYQRAATEQCVLNYMDDLYAVWNELEGADLPIEGVVVSKMEFFVSKDPKAIHDRVLHNPLHTCQDTSRILNKGIVVRELDEDIKDQYDLL